MRARRRAFDSLGCEDLEVRHRLVFAHGAGRSGAEAWPQQFALAERSVFVTFPGYGQDPPRRTDMDAWVQTLFAASSEPVHLIAHSYGSIPAVLAAAQQPGWCRSLLLFEPALYWLARGSASVEDHIARLTAVMNDAAELDTVTFWRRWVTAMTGTSPTAPMTPAELVAAERFRLLVPPWTYEVPSATFAAVDTLVVTADWNQEYEDIAAALAALGAEHRHLGGYGHRVVDHPAASDLIIGWTSPHD